jgi:hypothetical protein
MQDREFFDLLYQQFCKTTGAEKRFWMPEETAELHDGYTIYAVEVDAEGNQKKETVATHLTEADADFIAGVHGCIADLIRSLHSAHDEADRLDEEKDGLIVTLANREIEINDLHGEIDRLSR